MNMEQRREKMVELVNREGSVSFAQLKQSFKPVSDMTVRRDLEYLDKQKRIIRTHGGARSVEVLAGSVLESTTDASEESLEFNEEKFFVVVGTYSGGYTQLRYLYPTSSGAYNADKVILSDDTKYAYGDVLTCKGDSQMTRVQSAPDDPVYAMAYHYSLDEAADLTKVGNCKDLLEKKVLTVTDAVYDGSGHWSYHLADATGTEYYYGLNIFGSSLDVSLSEANIGDAVTFAMYRDTPAIPLSIGEVKESPQTAAAT